MFWLASPGFAKRVEPVEEFLRHQVALEERQVEIVVLVVARHWTAQYVWSSHAPAALKQGVEADVVEAIRIGAPAQFDRNMDTVLYRLCKTLLDRREVDYSLWAQAQQELGECRINEVFGLLGLYTSVSLTMVSYRMPTKLGVSEPMDPLP